jgi:acylphosphatase
MSEVKRLVRRRIVVQGRVQGVFFRASTRDMARSLGLVGWVRNLPDHTVEIEVEGSQEAVAELIRWAHDGPPAANVTTLVESPLEPLAAEGEFHVRY